MYLIFFSWITKKFKIPLIAVDLDCLLTDEWKQLGVIQGVSMPFCEGLEEVGMAHRRDSEAMKTLFSENARFESFFDRSHGCRKRSAWKRTFLKMGLRVEKSENAASHFPVDSESAYLMTPSPHPSTSYLWPLNPTMSHNINNNNNNYNGGLHACVRATKYIEPFLQLTRHSSSSTSLTVHTNDSGFLVLAIFIFTLLCLVSPSTVCLFTARN